MITYRLLLDLLVKPFAVDPYQHERVGENSIR
jgi:hypothetical protein